jgi:ABC-type Na+ efflux pump permease subunit
MLIKLLLKDLRAFGKSLLIIAGLSLLLNTIFSFLDTQSWLNYLMMSAGQISFIIGYFLTGDKMRHGELLICSLPVSRRTIMQGKYLAAMLLALSGMVIWFLYAWLLHSIFTRMPGDFHLFTKPMVLFWIIFYFSFFISAFIPLVTIMDKIWALTNLSILFAAIFIVAFSFFYETSGWLQTELNTSAFGFVSLLTVIMIILIGLSILLSNRLFLYRDL